VFFEYVGQSYGFFLSGDDDACGQLDEELARTFAARDEEAVAGIDQLEAANAALQEEIEALKATPSPVLELQVGGRRCVACGLTGVGGWRRWWVVAGGLGWVWARKFSLDSCAKVGALSS
jgi:hypothetical protein